MGPAAYIAARSGIVAMAGAVVMSATWCALIPGAPAQWKIDAFQHMFAKPSWWAIALLGWLGLFVWMHLAAKSAAKQQPPLWAQIGWWIVSTLAAAIAMTVLSQGVSAVVSPRYGMPTWYSVQHLFEAALFAVVVVRLALPLLPRFDRMSPRNV